MAAWARASLVTAILAALASPGYSDSVGQNCEGGSRSACSCLLSCKVFGGHPGGCDTAANPTTEVDVAVQASLKKSGTECDGITCVVQCAKQLGCLDDAVKGRCMNVKADRPGCKVNCDGSGAHRGSGAHGAIFVALLFAVVATSNGLLSSMW